MLVHKPSGLVRLYICVDASQSLCQLVNDLRLTQLDHTDRLRDLDSLERWSHSEPHKLWWQQYLRDSGGTGLWHETYFMGGGIEAIYDDMNRPTGIARFAPVRPARGAMFSARRRAGRSEEPKVEPVIAEAEYYSG